jgi:hypothetical protein
METRKNKINYLSKKHKYATSFLNKLTCKQLDYMYKKHKK